MIQPRGNTQRDEDYKCKYCEEGQTLKVGCEELVLRYSQLVDHDDIACEPDEEGDVRVVAGPEIEPAPEQ